MIGQHCYQLIHQADQPCPDCPCAITFRTGESATAVHTGLDAQGGTTWAEIVSLPVRDASGQVTCALEAVRDVSERERHLRQLGSLVDDLRTSDEQLRRRNEELEILNGLMLRAGAPLRMPDLLDALLSAALRVAGPRPPAGSSCSTRRGASCGWPPTAGWTPTSWPGSGSVRLGECLCGTVALSGEVVIAGRAADGPPPHPAAPPRRHGHVIIPLSSHEQVLGVLFVHLPPGQAAPPPEREQLFRLMGRQIGISIENAQLYQRTDAQLRQKVGELTRALSTRGAGAGPGRVQRAGQGGVRLHGLARPALPAHRDPGRRGRVRRRLHRRRPAWRPGPRSASRRAAWRSCSTSWSTRPGWSRGRWSCTGSRWTSPPCCATWRPGASRPPSAPGSSSATPLPEVELLGDRSWLERALVNVIGNALKFAPDAEPGPDHAGGRGRRRRGGGGRPGARHPARRAALVFQRFYRASNTRRRIDGSGLGLFIARQVVEAHGGEASVQSEVGSGTTIRFRLPLRAG